MKRKRILAIMCAVAAGIVMAVVALFAWVILSTEAGYWLQKQPIKKGFANIPGCTLISISGNEDVTLEHITARVELEGKGTLIVSDLGPESFRSTGEIRLKQIGTLEMRQHEYGFSGVYITATGAPVKSHGYARWIDIGADGPYARLLPVEVQNIQDIVEHFDELQATFSGWPRHPKALTVTMKDGTIYEASVVDITEENEDVRTKKSTLSSEGAPSDER